MCRSGATGDGVRVSPGPTLMPSMVRLVSAMLVASTTFLAPTGVVSKMRACAEFPLSKCYQHGGCQTEMQGLTGLAMPVRLAAVTSGCSLPLSSRPRSHRRSHQS